MTVGLLLAHVHALESVAFQVLKHQLFLAPPQHLLKLLRDIHGPLTMNQ